MKNIQSVAVSQVKMSFFYVYERSQKRVVGWAQADRKATVTQITECYNTAMKESVFECTTLLDLEVDGRRRRHRLPLLSANDRGHSLKKVEDWNNMIWSKNKSQFSLLLHAGVRVRIRIFEF